MKAPTARPPAGRILPHLRGAKVALLIIACVSFAVLSVAAPVWQQARASSADGSQAAQSASQRQRSPSQVESEVITITPHGFTPAEITRPQGQFFLLVDNQTGAELNIHISSEAGPELRAVSLPQGQTDWGDLLDPPAGHYVLTEAGHPDWACSITITPR